MDKLVANGQPIEIRENVVVTREQTTEDWIKEWLCTFNTDSATECFTAVQQLKEKIEKEN